jgi:hypothetical protein
MHRCCLNILVAFGEIYLSQVVQLEIGHCCYNHPRFYCSSIQLSFSRTYTSNSTNGTLISFLGSMIRSSKPEGSEYVVFQKHDKHCNECLYRSNDCCCISFSVLYKKNGTNSFFSISADESAIFISLI